MGLDMYLIRAPRYKDHLNPDTVISINDIHNIESYLGWWKKRKDPTSKANEHTLKEWCGVDIKDLPRIDVVEWYRPFYKRRYYAWDRERKYGTDKIHEDIGYWRKANHIHRWFVDNVQDEIDDCEYHHEVTKENLEELLQLCETIVKQCKLKELDDEKILCNQDVARRLLPTQSGFFFGGTGYDEWYLEDVKYTIKAIKKALKTTDFDKQMIYYCSSW